MKTTLNAEELRELGACCEADGDGDGDGLDRFVAVHGEKTVTFTQAFQSNGWNDVWWYIDETYDEFSDDQKRDLRLLAADYAERVLPIFEREFPNDYRPRLAIQAGRDFANGLLVDAARDAAKDAAWAAWAAARAAARAAELKWQGDELLRVIAKWESQV